MRAFNIYVMFFFVCTRTVLNISPSFNMFLVKAKSYFSVCVSELKYEDMSINQCLYQLDQ